MGDATAITSSRAPSPRSTFKAMRLHPRRPSCGRHHSARVFICPGKRAQRECGDALPTAMASAEDNCGPVQVTVMDTTAGDGFGQYVVVRTFVTTDDAGNSANATQTITIADTHA